MTDMPVLHVRVPDYVPAALDDLTSALASSGYAAEATLKGQLTRAQVIRLALARGMAELAREAAKCAAAQSQSTSAPMRFGKLSELGIKL